MFVGPNCRNKTVVHRLITISKNQGNSPILLLTKTFLGIGERGRKRRRGGKEERTGKRVRIGRQESEVKTVLPLRRLNVPPEKGTNQLSVVLHLTKRRRIICGVAGRRKQPGGSTPKNL